MEQQRLFLILLLGMVTVLMYFDWQKDYGPQPQQHTVTGNTADSALPESSVSPAPAGSTDDIMPVPQSSGNTGTASNVPAAPTQPSRGKLITIETDVLRMHIDTQGGVIREVDLLKYPVSVDQPDKPFRIMDDTAKRHFIATSGFHIDSNNPAAREMTPNKDTVYQTSQDHYRMTGDKLVVDLSWRNSQGVTFVQRYTFHKGRYEIDLTHEIANHSQQEWSGYTFARLERTPPETHHGLGMLPTYTGPVYYSPEHKYDKVSFSDIEDSKKSGGIHDAIDGEFAGGWIAMIEHYFAAAFVPPSKDVYRYFTHEKDSRYYRIGIVSTEKTVKPGQTLDTSLQFFVGPKIQKNLEVLAPGLELSVDYGWLTFLSKPLFWLLNLIHSFIGNWGWAIIVLTIMIKLVFYKLSEASYKSMARMKKLAPRMKQINDRYADDRQRKGQAIMELYKKEKVNPLGGCLPILIQIPVFLALYYVLLESVELRQAPWILWIHDLSIKDPYYVLPILMGASMFFQQKLNPPPPDPMQAKIMMMLPLVFTVLFLFFPSGLVLYWVVNNLLSMTQQYYITRVVMSESRARE